MTSFLQSISLTKRKKTPENLVSSAKTSLQSILDDATPDKLAAERIAVRDEGDSTTDGSIASVSHVVSSDSSSVAESKPVATLKKRLNTMKLLLYGDGSHDHTASSANGGGAADVDEVKAGELSHFLQSENLMLDLIQHMSSIPLEARKDTALIFNNLLRHDVRGFVSYVVSHRAVVLMSLVHGYEHPEVALSCGSMIREAVRHDPLHEYILGMTGLELGAVREQALVWLFFDQYLLLPNFDVSSDAFNTLRDLVVSTKNKIIASSFLECSFDLFFQKYEVCVCEYVLASVTT